MCIGHIVRCISAYVKQCTAPIRAFSSGVAVFWIYFSLALALGIGYLWKRCHDNVFPKEPAILMSSKQLHGPSGLLILLAAAFLVCCAGCGDDDPAVVAAGDCNGITFDDFKPTDENSNGTGAGGENDWCYPDSGADPSLPYLYPAYPNPFYPVVKISFSLPAASYMNLQILNDKCEVVRSLVDGGREEGREEVRRSNCDRCLGPPAVR